MRLVPDPAERSGRLRPAALAVSATVAVAGATSFLAWPLVALAGAATVVEYASGMRTGFEDLFDAGDPSGPRMAPTTAVSLVALGLAVFLLRRRPRPAQLLLLVGGPPGYVAILGYAAGSEAFYRVGSTMGMAVITAICLVLVALAALAVAPGGALPRVAAGHDAAAVALRVVMPGVVVLPPVAAAGVSMVTGAGWLAEGARPAVTVGALVALNVAVVLELAMRLRAVDEDRNLTWALAELDPVTGIANRRAFERVVDQWCRDRPSSPAAVLLVDLDNFKEVNDRWGHPAGDRVLVGFALALRDAMREHDVVARLGGDEFVVFLPDADRDLAGSAGRRVLDVAGALARAFPEARTVGASVGVGLVDGNRSMAAVLASADGALYQAKAAGKNRVAVAAAAGAR